MKGICLVLSRGRHFSPSLPDRGRLVSETAAHSTRNPRAEISGLLVMVRRSSASSRGTTYWFQYFGSVVSQIFRLRMRMLKCLP